MVAVDHAFIARVSCHPSGCFSACLVFWESARRPHRSVVYSRHCGARGAAAAAHCFAERRASTELARLRIELGLWANIGELICLAVPPLDASARANLLRYPSCLSKHVMKSHLCKPCRVLPLAFYTNVCAPRAGFLSLQLDWCKRLAPSLAFRPPPLLFLPFPSLPSLLALPLSTPPGRPSPLSPSSTPAPLRLPAPPLLFSSSPPLPPSFFSMPHAFVLLLHFKDSRMRPSPLSALGSCVCGTYIYNINTNIYIYIYIYIQLLMRCWRGGSQVYGNISATLQPSRANRRHV